MKQSQFQTIFMISALLLMTLPFISTFNEFLTSLFLKWKLYRMLEEIVVPYEAKVIAGIFSFLRMGAFATDRGVWLSGTFLEIQWNCLGWQSGVLLLASFLTGFQGNFSKISRLEVVVIGLLGTYLINLARMLAVGGFAVTFGQEMALVFHDWFSLVLVILWFFLYWYFSYSYVLEEVGPKAELGGVKIASNATGSEYYANNKRMS